MDFLAKYDFEFVYRRGLSIKATDFPLRVTNDEQDLDNEKRGDLVLVSNSVQDDASYLRDLEPLLRDVESYVAGNVINGKSSAKRAVV